MQQNIIVYGRADGSCQGCNDVKSYLDSLELEYDFRDIGSHDVVKRVQYKKELMADKVDKIPYIKIGENKFIGFSKEKLDEVLNK